MQIGRFLALAPLGLVLGQDVSADTLANDFKTLTGTMNSLTSTVRDFRGGILQIAGLNAASGKVTAAVATMNSDANRLKKLEEAEADKVLESVKAMEAPLDGVLSAIVEKKGTFNGVVKPRISRSLTQLVTATLSLADTLKTKVPDSFTKKVEDESVKMDEKFKKAVQDFA